MKDSIQTIRQASYRFFSGTLLSRMTGMMRDMSMAYVFGTQPAIAAFMVAFRLAHLLRRLFGEGALQSAFVPEFESLRHQDEQRAFAFFRNLTFSLSLFLILLIGMSSLGLSSLLWWGHFSHANQAILWLTLLMLPSLLFICLFGINLSFLQCEKIYFIPSLAPVAFNVIWIASVFYLKDTPADQAMPYLAIGVVIACFFQWILTVPQTWKKLQLGLPYSEWKNFKNPFSDLQLLIKPLTLGIIGVAASQINHAVDSLYARYAEPEGPALLWYALRIQQLPLALFGIAIAGAVLPPLSRARKAQQWDQYHLFLKDALKRTWVFIIPLTAMIFVMGDTIVSLLYGRGDFRAQSIIQTTNCLWAYGLGLIPSAFILILAPVSYARNNYRLPALASCFTMLLNVLLNSLFILYLGWGAISIAIATSISAWLNLFLLYFYLIFNDYSIGSRQPLNYNYTISLATFLTTVGTYYIRMEWQKIPFFSDILLVSTSFTHLLLILSQQVIVFSTLFLFCYNFLNLVLKKLNQILNTKDYKTNN